MVATDGYRLAKCTTHARRRHHRQRTSTSCRRARWPKPRAISAAARQIAVSALGAQSNQLRSRPATTSIIVRLVDGQYPNYEQVIPAKFDRSVTVNTTALIGGLRRAELVAGDRASMVKLAVANQHADHHRELRRLRQRLRRTRSRADRRRSDDRVQRALSGRDSQPRQDSPQTVSSFSGRSRPPRSVRSSRSNRHAALRADAAAAMIRAQAIGRVARSRALRAASNFRNYAELDFAPAPGLNVFVGANAQGKSNLLEAIAMLGTGKSFRTSRDSESCATACDSRSSRGEAPIARRQRQSRVHRCERARADAQDLHRQRRAASRFARFLGKHSRRHVRAGRSATRRRRAGAAARVSQRRAGARRSAATIAISRAIAKRCSKRTRCCAVAIALDPRTAGDLRTTTLVEAGTQTDAARAVTS